MNVIDFVETWWTSVRAVLESTGVVGRFERSPADRLNTSCNLNVRRDAREADLMVWDSGEAELAVIEANGTVKQVHFDDIRNQQELGEVLERIAALALSK